MRASRAGRTGRSWYGSYDLRYADPTAKDGVRCMGGHTNKAQAIRHAKAMVESGETEWTEVLTDRTGEGGGQLIARFPETKKSPKKLDKKTPAQLDAEIKEALSEHESHARRLQPVEGLRIPADARNELIRFWKAHPALRKGCLNKYGFDPINEEASYWRFGLAEPDHSDVLRAVKQNGGLFSLSHVKRWEIEELRDA